MEYSDYRYDTQLLIEGKNLSETVITQTIETELTGDCLLVVGDDSLIKVHYHTDQPWKLLELCTTFGEIFDIVVEDMIRQSKGLKG